ncbi:phage tail sheath subtilisin-like domain-containing protein [Kaustia mangrovi]|uniref:Phage tail sheath subtilisin-like domain-containing protein n=1 Tax=Kaustia mangrovi TaxID=2593653 RepID=A0A7S8HDT1_9HYPH|nr:phage tail sheath C-terminal domain-containing protein [Kaustia mangrovi]QPC44638.1 phage tail sheath subtilisin-like domain-containing protein [Kaustia mangrovi]
MTTEYLHGVRAIEISDGLRPVRRARSSVIGLVGTAPDADAATFPINTPVVVAGNTRTAALLGKTGTLGDAMAAIYAQIGAIVVVVRVEEGGTAEETLSNVIGDPLAKTGAYALMTAEQVTGYKPRILIAPGFTSDRPATGIQRIDVTAGGTDYTEAPTVELDGAPTVPAEATAIVENGAVTAVIVTQPGLGYSAAPTVTLAGGGGAGATATAVLGTTANPVAAALTGIAAQLRGWVFADGPNTASASAISARGDYGSDRLMLFDPHPLVWDTDTDTNVTRPASAFAAGVQAFVDNKHGFWWPLSNRPVNGIVGATRPIAFSIGDANSEHNLLNENEITTIIRKDGFRFFGLRSTGSDPLWAFLSVRRTGDMIMDEIEASHLWALDRPFSQQLLREIVESVNAYLRTLIVEGAIVGGTAWLNPDFNQPSDLVQGKLAIDFDIEPVAPIERLTFRVHRNPEYYTAAIEEIVRDLAA